jgi:Polyketide cyclase / dehydrase and lipid transport
MRVATSRVLPLPPEEAWRLLCDSRLELRPLCPVFFLGVPRPHECALPSGDGAVGAERECRSEQGTVHQRITVWEPPTHLRFHMETTTLGFDSYLDELSDDFVLAPVAGGTRVTRTTTVVARGWLRPLRYAMVLVGLKTVHRFVFRNWQVTPRAGGARR